MTALKCKMCGGTLEFKSGDTVATCDSCGTLQTLPKMDDEHRMNLYDRANHYRRANEFDKAMGIYEQILNEDRTDAESYWSLVLCRYGIEYVEDPHSHKRVQTVNRAQYTSIYDDADYKSALQYATVEQKRVYEEEAEKINEIQKGILAISQKEEPFDVFICYKETDANGRRTQDSVLANDLYHQLTQEGFKVFFSRITLEDKLGTAYEPYIFAALNSAKVMVVLGTKEEYFNAVWVKNEWSRFLALIRDGKKKILIPAYRDMDPYDLPEEFSHLQAQDMSKLGFMQDLIRGIKKLTGGEKKGKSEQNIDNKVKNDVQPLLTRMFMFLEDGNWEKADRYAERILDMNPKCANAYLGKLMVELRVQKLEQFSMLEESFEDNKNYKKYIQYADEEERNKIEQLVYNIKSKPIYEEAIGILNHANTTEECQAAKKKFESIEAYEDSEDQIRQCKEKIAEITERNYNKLVKAFNNALVLHDYEVILVRLQEIHDYKDSADYMTNCVKHIDYLNAMDLMEQGDITCLNNAKEMLLGLDGFLDSNDKITQIDEKINSILRKEARKKKFKMISGLTLIVAIVIGIIVLIVYFNSNTYKISKAKELVQDGKYQQARKILSEIEYDDSMSKDYEEIGDICFKRNSYNDALEIYQKINNKKKIYDTKSKQAEVDIKNEDFDGAISIYEGMGEKEKVNDTLRKKAYKLLETEKYVDAIAIFESLKDKDNIRSSKQKWADSYLRRNEYNMAYKIYKEIKDEAGKTAALAAKAKELYGNKKYSAALKIYKKIGYTTQVKEIQKILKEKALYKKAKKQYKMGLYEDALDTINKIEDYEPAASLKEKIENKIASMPPETPILTEFYNATVEGEETTIGVDWTSSQGASEYEYWVKETPCFADGTIWEELQPDVNTGTTVDLSYATSASDPLMVQIRVRAVKYYNGEKIYSAWSSLVTGYMNVY